MQDKRATAAQKRFPQQHPEGPEMPCSPLEASNLQALARGMQPTQWPQWFLSAGCAKGALGGLRRLHWAAGRQFSFSPF